jgi:hypothetical protein
VQIPDPGSGAGAGSARNDSRIELPGMTFSKNLFFLPFAAFFATALFAAAGKAPCLTAKLAGETVPAVMFLLFSGNRSRTVDFTLCSLYFLKRHWNRLHDKNYGDPSIE